MYHTQWYRARSDGLCWHHSVARQASCTLKAGHVGPHLISGEDFPNDSPFARPPQGRLIHLAVDDGTGRVLLPPPSAWFPIMPENDAVTWRDIADRSPVLRFAGPALLQHEASSTGWVLILPEERP